jgi:hypothetical protein
MQTSPTTNIKKEHISFELSVLLIGHNHDEARSVEHFHEYNHEASERIASCNQNNESEADSDYILSGRSRFLFSNGWKISASMNLHSLLYF